MEKTSFFAIVFGITELTVLPMNAIWYMQKLSLTNHFSFNYMLIARAVFAVAFRAFVGPLSLVYAWKVSGSLPNLLNGILSWDWYILLPSVINITVFSYFNLLWSKKMVQRLFNQSKIKKTN